MAKEVTAYLAKDGSVHLEKSAADAVDAAFDLKEDISDFLLSIKADDKDGHFRRLIARWEQYRADGSVPIAAPAPASAPAPSLPKDGVILVRGSDIKPVPKVHKKKAVVVGVWAGNQAPLKKEFGEVFELTIYTPDEVNRLQGTKDAHKVFVMRKFVSHRHTDILRSIGQEPLLINGGMGELKEALNAYAAG